MQVSKLPANFGVISAEGMQGLYMPTNSIEASQANTMISMLALADQSSPLTRVTTGMKIAIGKELPFVDQLRKMRF